LPATVGQPAPEFSLSDQQNNKVSNADLKGHKALVVFIPFPFSSICSAEVCSIRDDFSALQGQDAKVVVITADTRFSNAKWAEENNLQFPVLSDFWPHGAVAKEFGAFNENTGTPWRATFVLDKDGIVRDIIRTDSIGQAREHEAYARSLAQVS
jgi:peroxiredoxin